jgi:hypothetical protein
MVRSARPPLKLPHLNRLVSASRNGAAVVGRHRHGPDHPIRTRVLNDEWRTTTARWNPSMIAGREPQPAPGFLPVSSGEKGRCGSNRALEYYQYGEFGANAEQKRRTSMGFALVHHHGICSIDKYKRRGRLIQWPCTLNDDNPVAPCEVIAVLDELDA